MGKLKYTFDDYINNPSGKGSAVLASINKDQFEKELMTLEANNSKATYKIYKQNKPGGKFTYYIHFLIPSSTKGFFNDVVIELNSNSDDNTVTKTVKAYYVKFFSNDSNFVYTYAYSFKSHGVLITELEKLLPFRCISQKPVMRNPDNAMGYNKGIIYAYLIMIRDGLFNKETLNRNCKYASINAIRSTILPFDKKLQERRKIEEELKKVGRKQKQRSSKVVKSKNLLGPDKKQEPAKVSKTVSTVKTNSKSSITKKVKKR